MKEKGFTTTILHSDRMGSPEHGSLHKPIHTSVAYGYEDARDLAAVFQNRSAGFAYGRQNNPTNKALEEKITRMEDGVATVCCGTGMAAISQSLLALLRSGDHFVSSSFLFGNTNSMFQTLRTVGLEADFVDATDVANVKAALKPNTKLVFVETIANPATQVSDLKRIGELCKERGLIYVVDNTMTGPYLFRPKSVGASLVTSSLTKYTGGHGNALAGSVTDTGLYDWTKFENIYDSYRGMDPARQGITQIRKKGLRDFGGSLGPEAAHHISVGAETMALRMERQCGTALRVAGFLADHVKIKKVNYPGLPDHPQHAIARDLFRHFGGLLSFELDEAIDCFDFLNRLKVVISSSNLGDNRTLAIPVAHTIFYEMGPERRASMGIDDGLIRLSVGIEDPEDLLADFAAALG
ncbi:MAG: cystathionine gamma-synthase family protein [bacterium]|nr:cystathionine gamma-synthase family protein [bacterium]